MKFETVYISSNANQTSNVVDWGNNNLICYGACNSVLIYNPNYGSGGKVFKCLVGHLKRVNSCKWIKGRDVKNESEIVSGASDCNVIVWNLNGAKVVLTSHEAAVNIVDGVYKGNETIIASVALDRTVKIWYRPTLGSDFEMKQTLSLGYNIATSLKLGFLPEKSLILTFGIDNSNIEVYVESDGKFTDSAHLIGHEEWVQGLDFKEHENDILLASASQDSTIRLWRITTRVLKQKNLVKLREFNIYIESVLTGHEGWIYSVKWAPKSLQLLSASIDKSTILWECDPQDGVWSEKIRLGEIGGNTLGFYGSLFSPDGSKIFSYSYHGAFHLWEKLPGTETWKPHVKTDGHFSAVVDCAWEPHGEFLITCSSDQTTRIHAPWKNNKKKATWHEIARPQVHGYDMNALAIISRYKFCSAAEEKVIRVFEAPENFVSNFKNICNIKHDETILNSTPKGASVPSLGLSNKAVYKNDNSEDVTVKSRFEVPEESHFTATYLTEPPTEETLIQNTLWPEVQKLYGHGYEVFALASSPDGQFLASSCKSTKPEHAAILIWDTSTWTLTQKLPSHTLTVVQLQFSPNSLYLLSVSRDRRWTLFTKNKNNLFELTSTCDKKNGIHTRIIWTCSFTHDSRYFSTGSRDGKVVFWEINEGISGSSSLNNVLAKSQLEFDESITALAFAPGFVKEKYFIAVGFDSGIIRLYSWKGDDDKPVEMLKLNQWEAHHLTVKRLAFRPKFGSAEDERDVLQLASCSLDHCVKIHDIFYD